MSSFYSALQLSIDGKTRIQVFYTKVCEHGNMGKKYRNIPPPPLAPPNNPQRSLVNFKFLLLYFVC